MPDGVPSGTISADWVGTPPADGPAVPRFHPKFDVPTMADSDAEEE